MLYKYQATTPKGEVQTGTIEAANRNLAIAALQRRNLIVTGIDEGEKPPFWTAALSYFGKVKSRDIVMLSRQLSTLFEAKVPILTALQLLAGETENMVLRRKLTEMLDDIRGGTSISEAMAKHPEIFSRFYVSMVRSGEEAGKLDEVFSYLAGYLERNYELTAKARGALIYPAFVFTVFIGVMILMMTYIIPKLSAILLETGSDLPIYTQIIIKTSELMVVFGPFLFIGLIILAAGLWYWHRTPKGKMAFSRFQISVPFIGPIYQKINFSRMMDNFETMISSGISMVRALELTADVIDNAVYKAILEESVNSVRAGASLSETLSRYNDMPGLITQMIRVGEETGKIAFISKTLAGFYRREVDAAIQALMSLIEPLLIILLAGGVGLLVAGILGPIYNMGAGIG
jgi:type IV pilus assembly protein PilC